MFFPPCLLFLDRFPAKIQIKWTGSLWLSRAILIKQFCVILIPLTNPFLSVLFGVSAHFPENPSPPFEKRSARQAFKSAHYSYLRGSREFESFLSPLARRHLQNIRPIPAHCADRLRRSWRRGSFDNLFWVTPVRNGLTPRLVRGFHRDSNNLHLSNCNSAALLTTNVDFFLRRAL